MKKVLYAIIFLFTMTSVFALSAQNKKAVGKWKYEVAQAPYGYSNGVLEIKQEKDKLTGQVNFSSGEDLKLQKLTMRNDTLRANVYVESENVEIIAKISNSKMKGSVNTSMGVMSLEADKVIETKE